MRRIGIALAASALLPLPGAADAAPSATAIQPGAQVIVGGSSCTLNFVFTRLTKLYIGTAGHCGDVDDIARSPQPDLDIGKVVYSSNEQAPGVDFALIEIDRSRYNEVEASVRTWGGPTDVTSAADTEDGDLLLLTGYGLVFGENSMTRDRVGALIGDDENEYVADMISVNGDSGGPVIHHQTGRALGTIGSFNLPFSTDIGPTVGRILAKLRANGFPNIQLVTAPKNY